tara:strand:- start:30821 stop:31276 length:456 start_codon:yes stop_codon:yes gene_type:complete
MLNEQINPDAHNMTQVRKNMQGIYRANIPTWQPFQYSSGDLSASVSSASFTIFKLPPAGVVYAIKIKHTEAFNASTYTVSVGITGEVDRYIAATDVTTAPSGTGFVLASTLFDAINDVTATPIVLAAVSSDILSQVSLGKLSIWIYWSQVV